jgi:multidrug efflux pump subunit AcrA (membrane-fusion protein)
MDSGKYFIWKVVNGKAEKCEVDISERYGSKVVIKKGVKSGDVLIARGHKSISESDKLKIIK